MDSSHPIEWFAPGPARTSSTAPEPAATAAVFRSRRHPGDAGPSLVFARALPPALALLLLPLMVLATADMLLGNDPAGWLLWAAPVALAVATVVTLYRLRSAPVEIVLRGGLGGARTLWEVAANAPLRLRPIFRPRRVRDGLNAIVGEDVLTLAPDEWPEVAALEAALRAAADRAEMERHGHPLG